MRWLFTGKGMLTYSPSIVASRSIFGGVGDLDVQVTVAPANIGQLEDSPAPSAQSHTHVSLGIDAPIPHTNLASPAKAGAHDRLGPGFRRESKVGASAESAE